MLEKKEKRIRRHKRIRAKIFGTTERPRLCVFRSNKHIQAQLIDDEKGIVLMTLSDRDLKTNKKERKLEVAKKVGLLLAKKALEKNIKKVVFDRGGFLYHGRVKSLAEGAREGGLSF